MAPDRATILVKGPDRKGIIATITSWIFENNGNIVYLDQYTDTFEKMFFMRIEFDITDFKLPPEAMGHSLKEVCQPIEQKVKVFFSNEKKRVAVLVSKQDHCLQDLLSRWKSGELDADFRVVISNHPDHEELCRFYGLPYYFYPVKSEEKQAQERLVINTLKEYEIDTVILARYMQILSPEFVSLYPNKIINIHHSFLPAFVGADPYYQAFKRGVKIIGATSHYVTEELDQGPIIAQDVIQVSHRDSVEDMRRKGKDIERIVLARAVKLHLENKIIVHNGKTVVFSE